MSAIPTKHIDGDVSVGRNVSVGGDVNIQGRTRVGHDLVVEGWLDAPNIKGAQKGLFASPDDLRESYPQPRSGWWALVGTGFPLRLYRSFGGKWNDTGTAVTAVNISGFDYIKEVEEEIREEVDARFYSEQAARAAADGELAGKIAELETQAGAASGQMAEIESAVSNCQKSIDTLRARIQKLPVLDFAGTVEGVAAAALGPGRLQLQTAHAQGLTSVVFDTTANKVLLRITSGETAAYYQTWNSAGSGENALRASSEYVPGILLVSSGTPGVFHTWDGQGGPRLLGDISDISSDLARHESRLGDLVYKTNKLRSDADTLQANLQSAARIALDALNQSEDNASAVDALAARVTALEDGTGGSGGEVGECGCGAIVSERIEALFEEEPEPEGPADGEPVTTAQLDDLIDDGVAQTPVEAPPGEYRLDEDDINALIEDIFK